MNSGLQIRCPEAGRGAANGHAREGACGVHAAESKVFCQLVVDGGPRA
jgi:hypothetical protein